MNSKVLQKLLKAAYHTVNLTANPGLSAHPEPNYRFGRPKVQTITSVFNRLLMQHPKQNWPGR